MATHSENLRSAALMGASVVAFGTNDLLMKSLAGSMPLMQSVFLRSAFVPLFLLIFLILRRQPLLPRGRHDRLMVALRGVVEAVTTICFVASYFNMPIANATSILMAGPLAVTLAGVFFLGERVGWRRWLAIVFGFVGVLLIVRPGTDGFTIHALLAVAAVMGVAARDLLSRIASPAVPSATLAFGTAAVVLCVTTAGATMAEFRPVSAPEMALLAGAAFCLFAAYVMTIAAMRVGDISAVAPVRYTNLLVAMIGGYLIYGESVDALTLAGAAMVVLSGTFTLLRERKVTGAKNGSS